MKVLNRTFELKEIGKEMTEKSVYWWTAGTAGNKALRLEESMTYYLDSIINGSQEIGELNPTYCNSHYLQL